MNVLLWSLVLLCPLTSAERQFETEEDASALASGKQDTALEFGGKGLNSFKRLDASSKAGEPPPGDDERNVKPHQQQDAHAGQPMELYTMAKKVNDAQEELLRTHLDQLEGDSFAEQTEQMKREAANEQIPQSASLVELVDPKATAAATATPKPEEAVGKLQALAAADALKAEVAKRDQKHVDDVPDITAEVAGIKGLKVQEYEPTQATAAKAIDTKYKTHRTDANAAWLATIRKIKTDEQTNRAMFKAPDDKLHEKDMNLRYPEFLAAISTFQPDRLNSEKNGSVQKEAAAMMTSNDLANKETRVYADQMQNLADQTGEGYTKMGLNHFYGYDQIMGQIEEGHMVPGKAIRIAFPLENNINFEPNSNVFRGDSLKYVNGQGDYAAAGLPSLIKNKVEQYKGFHFTFCIEASSTISKASLNRTSKKMDIVDYSHEGGITRQLDSITDEERRKGVGAH